MATLSETLDVYRAARAAAPVEPPKCEHCSVALQGIELLCHECQRVYREAATKEVMVKAHPLPDTASLEPCNNPEPMEANSHGHQFFCKNCGHFIDRHPISSATELVEPAPRPQVFDCNEKGCMRHYNYGELHSITHYPPCICAAASSPVARPQPKGNSMCEINPRQSAFFRLEAFTAQEMSTEEFTRQVSEKLLASEMELNKDTRFRFHIHEAAEPAARVEQPTAPDVRETFKHLLSRTTGNAWEYYETVSGKYIVREDDGDDAGPLAQFESADDAAFVCSAKNAIAELLTAPAAPVVAQRESEKSAFAMGVGFGYGACQHGKSETLTIQQAEEKWPEIQKEIRAASQRTEGEGQPK